jgi:hypothetical protein
VKYETVLNMTTAKALGLDVPTSILLSADVPIEWEYRNARRLDRRRQQWVQTRTSSLGAARPLPPSADIGPGGQSDGQVAQFCLGRLALQVFRIKPFSEKPESAGLAPAGGQPAS